MALESRDCNCYRPAVGLQCRRKTMKESVKNGTRVVVRGMVIGFVAALVARSPVQAGDKIELSAPEKKGVLPKLPEKTRRDQGTPFQFLERGSSTGGAVDMPAPSNENSDRRGESRAQKRLLEALEKERNRGFAPDLGDTEDLDKPNGRKPKERDLADQILENDRRAVLERVIRNERRRGTLEVEDESGRDVGDFGDLDVESPDSKGDDAEDAGRAPGKDPLGRFGFRDKDRKDGDKDSTRRRSAREREEERDGLGGASVKGEKLLLSDPFSSSRRESRDGSFSTGFQDRSEPLASPSGAVTGAQGTVSVRERQESERQLRFQQILGTGEMKLGGSASLDGLNAPVKKDRSEEFRSLLSAPSLAPAGSSGAGLGIFGDPKAGRSPAAGGAGAAGFSAFQAPSQGLLPAAAPASPGVRMPVFRPQPVNIVPPTRTF